ncbi:MAG TPA: thioredoxin domain-containing protein [Paludibacter sp.]|nr:thioredoxin domain-containing protein [Paludibacter sp.]
MNRLSKASSPYLRQHAGNPVDWYEWGNDPLLKAQNENKPLIISIGYAACHWCHVMAHESFSDSDIADYMNRNFVCIKIDREERPDIDQIYMEAAHLLGGQSGWPLNAFATPEGKPFFVGTYFPPEQWMDALNQISRVYNDDPSVIEEVAESLMEGLNTNPFTNSREASGLSRNDYDTSYQHHVESIDFKDGGYSGTPKFVLPASLDFFLQYHVLTGEQKSLDAPLQALDAIAKGGIHDQVGGGFARYSTDRFWKVPHFEKMLYDNAQITSLYAHAYQLVNKKLYAEIIDECIAFAERELRDESGGFYASIDADSEEEEGKFYVWTQAEIEEAVDPEYAAHILRYYQVTPEGNWERGKNILHTELTKEKYASRNGLSEEEFEIMLERSKILLLDKRNERIRPTTDDKILTSWNALMISAYVDAYKALGKDRYLNGAMRTARFVVENMMREDGFLNRVYKDGKVTIDGFLEDYATLAEAFIGLYEVTFDRYWLMQGHLLMQYVLVHFADSDSNLFFYTSDESENLIARKHEITDNVIPSSNSVLAHAFYKMGILFDDATYSELAEKMVVAVRDQVKQYGSYFANWAALLGKLTYPVVEIAIVGENALPLALEIQKSYWPNEIFSGGMDENLPLLEHKMKFGKTLVYVCKDKACNLPVETAEEAIAMMKA